MRWTAIGGLATAVLLTAACGSATGVATATGPGTASGSAGGSPAPVSGPGSARCPIERLPEGSVPAGFAALWVLRCTDVVRSVTGDGLWWFRLEERADTGIDPLLAALRRPDETPPRGPTVCTGSGASPVALVDAAGRVVRPRLPRDGCDGPQRQVRDAVAALRFRETKVTRLSQEQSQQSIDTGCGQMWTDLAGDMLVGRPAADRPTWRKVPEAVRICLWQPPRGTELPRLLKAGTVAGADLEDLLTRLDRLPAAGAKCAVPHHRFATLEYVRHGWYDSAAYAELDGCRRIVRPDGTLGELDPATAELITRLA